MGWSDWHHTYDRSPRLQARLAAMQRQIRATLDECPPGPITVLSICAGDGRDLLGVLPDHPRRDDVSAWLIETDAPSLERARAAAAAADLQGQLQLLERDATRADSYQGIPPADVMIVSGVLGHLSGPDILTLLQSLPMLCSRHGCVIWNRSLFLGDAINLIDLTRRELQRLQFVQLAFEVTSRQGFVVSRSRFEGMPRALDLRRRLFHFRSAEEAA